MSFYLLAESFGRYGTGNVTGSILDNMLSRYTFVSGGVVGSAFGRNGQGFKFSNNSNIFKTTPHSSRWVVGFAAQIPVDAPNQAPMYIIQNNDRRLVQVFHNTDHTISLVAGFSNFLTTTDRAMNIGHWYYLELDVTFSGTAPIMTTATLRINGHEEITGTGTTETNATGVPSRDATGNVHVLAGLVNNDQIYYDDWYAKNAAGYYGDIRIIPLFPNGEGATLQWTPSTGTVHNDMVKVHPVTGTTWLSAGTVGLIDTWDWEDCPGFTGTIKAVNLGILADKDDEGSKSFQIVVGTSGTATHSDDFYVSSDESEYYEYSMETDPATGSGWTQVGFNATQFGIKLTT